MQKHGSNLIYFFGALAMFIVVFFFASLVFFLAHVSPIYSARVYDIIGPTITITRPVNGPAYSTAGSTIVLGGVAYDNIAVTQIAWKNLTTGEEGLIDVVFGTPTWTSSPIPLQLGMNTIVIGAYDARGNNGTDTITINYTLTYFINIMNPTENATFITGKSSILLGGNAIDGMTRIVWNNTSNTGTAGELPASTLWTIPNIPLVPGENVIQIFGF